MSTTKELQRVELLNYTKANGEELIGLAVELAEDPSGGVQVRVLMDANVVRGGNSGPPATRRLLRLINSNHNLSNIALLRRDHQHRAESNRSFHLSRRLFQGKHCSHMAHTRIAGLQLALIRRLTPLVLVEKTTSAFLNRGN